MRPKINEARVMMANPLAWFLAHYHWLAALCAVAGIIGLSVSITFLKVLSPAFREAKQVNDSTLKSRLALAYYVENQTWNRSWMPLTLLVIFAGVMPFFVTLNGQVWWKMLLDGVVILFAYDFVYYLTHRFIFHDSAFMGGPLKQMHAIHHRQHNPCRADSAYLHPLESAIGLGLFVGTALMLSLFLGPFNVVVIVVAWCVFTELNLHNHTLWSNERFAFGYLNYASRMHHNHHIRFTGGNFATLSLLYDWMFGTLDNGDGYKSSV